MRPSYEELGGRPAGASRSWASTKRRPRKPTARPGCGRSSPGGSPCSPCGRRATPRSLDDLLGRGVSRAWSPATGPRCTGSLGSLQWCWAHLKRDFQALIDSGDPPGASAWVPTCVHATRRVVRALGRVPRTERSRGPRLLRRMGPVRRRDRAVAAARCRSAAIPPLRGMCRELYDHREWLWTFLRHEGVEPTNNASERPCAMRSSGGSSPSARKAPRGSRFVETMLTVVETCRQQQPQRLRLPHPSRRSPSRTNHPPPHCSPGRERLPGAAACRLGRYSDWRPPP